MTESEAIEKLKNMRLFMQIEDENNDCKFTEDDYKANEMAIRALEKQIPKKPTYEGDGYAQTEHLYMILGFALAAIRDMRLIMMIMITVLIVARS